jgi:diguanylate cyclase (GGDEF)-like protein
VELLVMIAHRLSRSLDMSELRTIAADVVSSTFDADEVSIVYPKDPREHHLYRWNRGTNLLVRGKIDDDPLVRTCIKDWLENKLATSAVSANGRDVYLPIAKGEAGLALILIRKHQQPVDPERLKFIGPVGNHMAIAFENARLYTLAITDDLTRLYSVRHFHYCIDREFLLFDMHAQAVTLIMIDIDDFKKVNDTYGHPMGDAVLKQVGQCLLESIRDNDLPFRYGGEELAVILPATNALGALSVANRIRESIEQHQFGDGGGTLRITVSIGLASCPEHARTANDLFAAADAALYEAKRSGKNRIHVSP